MAMDYTNIDEVVNDFQLMIDDTSYDKNAQIYQLRLLALQGLRELTFDVEQSIKTTTRAVTSSLATSLPNDYVKLLRVGYKNDDGDFISLGYKSNLSLDANVSSKVGSSSYDENNPYYHTDIGKKFGVGGGKNSLGYYRVNRSDNVINFSSELSGKTVFLEYISDGIGFTQPRDHVIQLDFNSSGTASGQIVPGAELKIPRPDSFSSSFGYAFVTGTPTTNANIKIGETDNPFTIAEKFSTAINEGYPDLGIFPKDTRIKASQHKQSNKVVLTYSDITAGPYPLSLNHSTFNSNLSQNLSNKATLQIGLTGSDFLKFTAVNPGDSGNLISVEIALAGTDSEVSIAVVGNAITISIGTANDMGPDDIVTAYNASATGAKNLASISRGANNINHISSATSQTFLSGGLSASTDVKVLTSQTLIQQGIAGRGPRVHKFCEEALRCYIYYKYIQRKRGVPANEKQMAKRAYYNEKRLARARMMNFNKEAAMQTSRKAFKQSPKI